jgi:hypothetical protein
MCNIINKVTTKAGKSHHSPQQIPSFTTTNPNTHHNKSHHSPHSLIMNNNEVSIVKAAGVSIIIF